LTTTFTASQGLLLMIPNMYKIAGELTPTVFHIAARSVAAQALSIFGDHSDVMAARATGWAMLFSGSVQEVMDFALIAQAATLETRVPFLHIMDGFRTSHEIQKIERVSDQDILSMLDERAIRAHRMRAMSPDRPFIRGTAQNPDVFFQARESVNPFYDETPEIVERIMNRFAERTGRRYGLFDYVGAPDAERVLVLQGSGCETAEETVTYLADRGEKVGAVKVRLFRPFSSRHFLDALPETTRVLAVLDRTKEPGSAGEPLYQDVMTAIGERFSSYDADGQADAGAEESENGDPRPVDARPPRVIGGRYGLSSKEFTPAMIKGIFDEMNTPRPKNHFTVGIYDDVTHTSLDWDPAFDIEPDDVTRAVFWGLGSDGTVGANKNSIKIIGEETDRYAQGYFVYDSRKAGARTISHLRFGPRPIRSTYLIRKAGFVAVHQFGFLERYDTLEPAAEGATLLLNCPHPVDEMWEHVPERVRRQIVERKLTVYAIDAYEVAREVELGARINTIMQTCFFALSGVLPKEEAIEKIKEAIRTSYGKRGEAVVRRNFAAVDATLERLHQVEVPRMDGPERPADATEGAGAPSANGANGAPSANGDGATGGAANGTAPALSMPDDAPAFVRNVTGEIIAGRGDLLPVSTLPVDGTYPSGTTRYEKRNLALEVPVWDPDICIQCGKCVMVCPHAVIRAKLVGEDHLVDAPDGFLTADAQWREKEGDKYTLQVAVEDCTACRLCVEVCPVKDKSRVDRKAINMEPQLPLREQGRVHWDYFLELPDTSENGSPLKFTKTKDVQLLEPLFEFSGACAGCGETPYLSLMTRLFGDRAIVANATGCSSIYGGNLPTTPWTKNKHGRGPAWNNSLFEDNAEFGLGMRLAVDKQAAYARELVERLRETIGDELASGLLEADQSTAAGIEAQRERVDRLKEILGGIERPSDALSGEVDDGTVDGVVDDPAGTPAVRDLAG
ncbi:MAG: 2-oxoacid:acceptor oxidoreductase family protein, partial [Rhodothermales bacterium]